jgi:hypothetical protein
MRHHLNPEETATSLGRSRLGVCLAAVLLSQGCLLTRQSPTPTTSATSGVNQLSIVISPTQVAAVIDTTGAIHREYYLPS